MDLPYDHVDHIIYHCLNRVSANDKESILRVDIFRMSSCILICHLTRDHYDRENGRFWKILPYFPRHYIIRWYTKLVEHFVST